jgi:hypothetical protein
MHTYDDEQRETRRAAIFHDEKSIYLMRRSIVVLVCIIVEDIFLSYLFFSLRCIWIYGYDLNGRELERGACD